MSIAIGIKTTGRNPELPNVATSSGGCTREEWGDGPIGFADRR